MADDQPENGKSSRRFDVFVQHAPTNEKGSKSVNRWNQNQATLLMFSTVILNPAQLSTL